MLLRGPQINNMPSKSPVIALLTYTKRSHDLNLLKIVGMELLTDIYKVAPYWKVHEKKNMQVSTSKTAHEILEKHETNVMLLRIIFSASKTVKE